MGRLQQFRTYMLDNRRQQLNVDLAAPVNFAEAYQGLIAQVSLGAWSSLPVLCALCTCWRYLPCLWANRKPSPSLLLPPIGAVTRCKIAACSPPEFWLQVHWAGLDCSGLCTLYSGCTCSICCAYRDVKSCVLVMIAVINLSCH